jgi:hypothetical protein
MHRRLLIVWFCFVIGATGCQAHMLLSTQAQEKIQNDLKYRPYYLNYSLYYGQFYEYDDRYLVSERAFDERVLIQSPGGDPILPPNPLGILPMGTKMVIRQIDFPTSGNLAIRKLRSPRYFTWVTLERKDTPNGKPYVLILTPEFANTEQFMNSLKEYLTIEDPLLVGDSRSSEELRAIDTKTVWKGMRADALVRSRGYPDRINRKFENGVKVERWEYAPRRTVVLKDDVVESFEGVPALINTPGSNPK